MEMLYLHICNGQFDILGTHTTHWRSMNLDPQGGG